MKKDFTQPFEQSRIIPVTLFIEVGGQYLDSTVTKVNYTSSST